MRAQILISGIIGRDAMDFFLSLDEGYTDLADVMGQVKQAPEAEGYDVIIDSPGGYVHEGFAIAQYIETLPNTRTVARNVFSTANLVFFAGQERTAEPGATFMLHSAWVNTYGNASELKETANALEAEDMRMASYIASKSGLSAMEVLALMGETDRYINAMQAERLGFFGSRAQEMRMAALHIPKKNKRMTMIEKALAFVKGVLGRGAKAMEFKTKDGAEIFVETEDGALDGKNTDAADGEYVLEDGTAISVKDGVISVKAADAETEQEPETEQEIEVEVEAPSAEMEALKKENEDLKAKVAELEASFQESAKQKEEEMAKALADLKRGIFSTAKPAGRAQQYGNTDDKRHPLAMSEDEQRAIVERFNPSKK